ncbi:hypothetical protein M569_17123, partial [Genlisea aurea]
MKLTRFDSFLVFQVGHTKGYVQVLVEGPETMLGKSVEAKITSIGRWSVFGEVVVIEQVVSTKSETKKTVENGEGSVDSAQTCSAPSRSVDGGRSFTGGWLPRRRRRTK